MSHSRKSAGRLAVAFATGCVGRGVALLDRVTAVRVDAVFSEAFAGEFAVITTLRLIKLSAPKNTATQLPITIHLLMLFSALLCSFPHAQTPHPDAPIASNVGNEQRQARSRMPKGFPILPFRATSFLRRNVISLKTKAALRAPIGTAQRHVNLSNYDPLSAPLGRSGTADQSGPSRGWSSRS